MARVAPFNQHVLEGVAKVLAETDKGLTGSEIGHILRGRNFPDPSEGETKWKRLFNSFVVFQNERQFGNHVVLFINEAMNPARYTSDAALFEHRRTKLNAVLALAGLTVGKDGKTRHAPVAATLDEALERANRLQHALESRSVHPDVLAFCRAELMGENYFHAVFEAMKSIAAKIRTLSGLTGDGAPLVNDAFALGKSGTPVLAINALKTETDKGEQRGFANLLIGLFGTIRNPAAHNPKIEWPMPEQDALDILTTASLIHRKLDKAYRYPSGGQQ